MDRAIDSPHVGVAVDSISCKQLRDAIRNAKDHFLATQPAYNKNAGTMFSRARFKSKTLMTAAEMMAHHDKLSLLEAIYEYLSNDEEWI